MNPSVQLIEYMNVPSTSVVINRVPLPATVPAQGLPSAPPPLAVQVVAVWDVHARVNELPSTNDLGVAVNVTWTGAAGVIVSSALVVACGPFGSTLLHVSVKVYFPATERTPGCVKTPLGS